MSFFKLLLQMMVIFFLFAFTSCTTAKKLHITRSGQGYRHYSFYEKGLASFYGSKWAGRKTANGKIYNPNLLTAASRTLPFNSMVLVKDTTTKRQVIVRITDRGPYVKGRVIDLSAAAARKLGMTRRGVAHVNIYLIHN